MNGVGGPRLELRLYHGKAAGLQIEATCRERTAYLGQEMNPGQSSLTVLVTGANCCAIGLPTMQRGEQRHLRRNARVNCLHGAKTNNYV